MNNLFANIGKQLATPPQTDEDGTLNSYIYRVTPTISTNQFSKEILLKLFKATVKIGKAGGPDNITARHLSLNPEASVDGFQHVVKCSLSSGSFPTQWKTSKVSAVFKKGSKSDCSDYRAISLLSIPSKIVKYLVCSQLIDHIIESTVSNLNISGASDRTIDRGYFS